MRRHFWLALDAIGHKIPLLRFGRLRYAICLRADAYMIEEEFDAALEVGEPVELNVSPTLRIRSGESLFVDFTTGKVTPIPQPNGGTASTITYRITP